jgi:hypothetical protein
MDQGANTPKRKVLKVDRGLFLVRYASAEDGRKPPVVRVSLDPSAGAGNAIVTHPDSDEAVLWQPGSALVVRTMTALKLLVEVSPLDRDGSTAAVVNVEALTFGDPPAATSRTPRDSTQSRDLSGISLLGHVAGLGDVTVGSDEWIAGPSAPSRIEGIAISWPDQPAGVELRYAVNATRSAPKLSGLGSFAGTRGHARPVTGLTLELSGANASDLQLRVEALFLGSPTTRASGKRIAIAGVSGREPLVGLRLRVEPVAKAQATAATTETSEGRSSGGVRVFRSRASHSEATV